MRPTRDPLVLASRRVNWILWRRRESICAWLDWEACHRPAAAINWVFFCLRGEIGHCRNVAQWEEGPPEARGPVDKLRRKGLL